MLFSSTIRSAFAVAALLFCQSLCLVSNALAQSQSPAVQAPGIWSQETVDTIIDAEVIDGETDVRHGMDDIIQAVEKSDKMASTVRKTSNVDVIDIAFLTDIADPKAHVPKLLADSLKAHQAGIDQLRQELEGNALLYHAIQSHGVLMRDVLAVRIENNQALIYVAAKPR
ncbi:MAG: hypothetical protein L0I29_01435 [Hyphomicrobiales bacterium]|nr:hypothetical protein [Hyphomicrobiales bacterium]